VIQVKSMPPQSSRIKLGSDCIFIEYQDAEWNHTLTAYDKDLNELWTVPDRYASGYIDGSVWAKDPIDGIAYFEYDPLTGTEGRNFTIGSFDEDLLDTQNLIIAFNNDKFTAIRKSDLSTNIVNIGNPYYQFYVTYAGDEVLKGGLRNLCAIDPPMINDCALVANNNTLYCIYVG